MALCMNCGCLYTLDGKAWRPATKTELEALTPEERRELALAALAIAECGFPDLAKRGGRA